MEPGSALAAVGVAACQVGNSSSPTPARSPASHPAPAFSGNSWLALRSKEVYTSLAGNSNLVNLRV